MLTSVLDNTDSSKGALCFLDNHIVFNMKNKILQNNMDAVVQLTTFNVLLSRNTAEMKIQFYCGSAYSLQTLHASPRFWAFKFTYQLAVDLYTIISQDDSPLRSEICS